MNGSVNWRNYDLCGDVNDKTLIVAFVVHDHLMRTDVSDSSYEPSVRMATVAPSQPLSLRVALARSRDTGDARLKDLACPLERCL